MLYKNFFNRIQTIGGHMVSREKIELLLNQAYGLLEKIENYHDRITITPQISAEIERLQRNMAVFLDYNDKTYAESNFDFKKVEEDLLNSPNTDPNDKALLEKIREIKKEAEGLQASYKRVEEKAKKKGTKSKKPANDPLKQQMKERRKKFKKIGGDHWIQS